MRGFLPTVFLVLFLEVSSGEEAATPGRGVYGVSGGGTTRCTIGPPVKFANGRLGFITCPFDFGNLISFELNGESIGNLVEQGPSGKSSYGLVQLDEGTKFKLTAGVTTYDGNILPIKKFGKATVGQKVRRSGSTTKVQEGVVKSIDATVSLEGGVVVRNLVKTTACAEPGDAGSPLFDNETWLGVMVAGTGNCQEGGRTFFSKVGPILMRHNLELYKG